MPLSDEFYLREIVKLLAGPDGEGADALETIYRAIQAASGGGGGGGGGGGSFGPDTSIQMTVQNKSGDTLVKGSSVALTWVETGAHPAVIDFRDSDPDGRDHVLGVLAETIADNAAGLCTVRGPLTGIDTSGFSLGAIIYAGSPAGPSGWVAGFPASPYSHQLGVITVVDAAVGEIYVLPEESSVPDHGHTGPGDGGGVPAEFSIGAYIETFGGVDYPANNNAPIPLDTGHAVQYYLTGLTLNGTNDGLVVATAGRYLLTSAADFAQHATAWLWVLSGSFPSNGSPAQRFLPPAAVATFVGAHETPKSVEIMELAVGDVIKWLVVVNGVPGGESVSMLDGYLQVQYVGPIPV